MTPRHYCWLAAFAASMTLSTVNANAQSAATPAASAQTLHDQGRALMKQHRYREAYVHFEQSLALREDLSTRFRYGQCAEQLDKLATALNNYRQVIEQATAQGETKRAAFAQRAADKIASRVPKIRLVLSALPSDGAELTIVFTDADGLARPVKREEREQPRLLDAGAYTLTVAAPGHETWSKSLQLYNGQPELPVAVPALKPLPTVVPQPPKPEPLQAQSIQPQPLNLPPVKPLSGARAAPPPTPRPVTIQPAPETGDSLLWAGVITTAAGASVLAGGVTLALVGEAHYADSAAGCSSNHFCEQDGLDLRAQARKEAIAGVVLETAGLIATGIGIGVWVLAATNDEEPSETATARLQLKLLPTGAQLLGRW